MDAVDVLKVCVRRWWIMLPILLGAAGVSYQLVQAQETTFSAAASYGLVQPDLPRQDLAQQEGNPFGTDGSGLVGSALEAQLSSRELQDRLGDPSTRGWGPGDVEDGSSYSVTIPPNKTTYEVRAWGEDERTVRDVVDRVIAAAPGIVEDLQARAGVPGSVRYEPFILAPTQVDALSSASAAKLVIAVMGLGLMMGAAWSVVIDRVLRRVPQRRASVELPDMRTLEQIPRRHVRSGDQPSFGG